jgi:hypothetical protein
MNDRERLIELICEGMADRCGAECKIPNKQYCEQCFDVADYLLEHGVIVPPCKVGDMVYVIYKGYITSSKVLAFYYDRSGGMFDMQIKTKVETATGFEKVIDKDNYQFSDFGKTVFLTREEAEKALKGE